MAGTDRSDSRALEILEGLRQAPGRFDLFQVLRRLECAYRERPRLGESRHPWEDPIRISQDPDMAFAPGPIAGLEWSPEGPPRLITQFLGLFGPNGPLPSHITEYARDRLHNAGDPTFARFVDMCHHRMLSLFYRAFANNEPAVSADRPESDRFSAYVGSLIGRGMPSFLGRDALPDNVRLYYAGRFAAEPKNAEGLRAIVSDFFGLPVEIEEFVGEWIDVPQDSRWCLGRSAIGRSATVGARTWLCQGKFRIVIGPADQERAKKLFPGGEDFARLEAIVRSYIGDQLAWDVRILVHKESRHPWCLGRESRLGWTSSLGRGREHGNVIIR